jgi:hypothetical protein
MANKVAEESQRAAHASEERANHAETAQRSLMVSSPSLSLASHLFSFSLPLSARNRRGARNREIQLPAASVPSPPSTPLSRHLCSTYFRDLIREQKMRKQLHNEIEDMKGPPRSRILSRSPSTYSSWLQEGSVSMFAFARSLRMRSG